MKIHFLGTAASEGIPNPFCRCEHCQQARIRKSLVTIVRLTVRQRFCRAIAQSALPFIAWYPSSP